MIDFVAPCGANQVGPPKKLISEPAENQEVWKRSFPDGRYNDTLGCIPNASCYVSMNMSYMTEKKLMTRSQDSGLDLYNLCYIWLLICNNDPLEWHFDGRKRLWFNLGLIYFAVLSPVWLWTIY